MESAMKRVGTILTMMTALAISAAPALAQRKAPAAAPTTASVYAIHGISGDDLGAGIPRALPVDVWVKGVGCAIPNFTFGQVAGPLALPAGSYDIEIRFAASPACSGATAISAPGVAVSAGRSYTIVAHFKADADGELLGVGATAFENDVTPTGPGRARIAAHHTALAPEVDVYVSRDLDNPTAPAIVVPEFVNGDSVTAPIKPGDWQAALKLGGTDTVALGPAMLTLKPFTGYFVYAIGSAVTGSLDLRLITIENLR
jgi:hypothetical protein